MIISGIIFGKYIGDKIHIVAPKENSDSTTFESLPNIYTIVSLMEKFDLPPTNNLFRVVIIEHPFLINIQSLH
jgi:hypothetical protein